MFRLKNHLVGSAVYLGKKLTFAGCIRAQIKEIYVNGMLVRLTLGGLRPDSSLSALSPWPHPHYLLIPPFSPSMKATSGYITADTKTIFRSESAKYFIFLQLSREMFEFNEEGDLYVERATRGFLPDLFQRWRSLGTNHVVSIVLFTRVIYDPREVTMYFSVLSQDRAIMKPELGGPWYKDFYKVCIHSRNGCTMLI